ncbi:hypothetical protein AVEN_25684-1 [Araneus ventricosus]|uniref:Uncharacterized protein n=1 Tax=Araneus ventricosus TaxID=182803 RepID=A0A4Y2TYH1_ARAVE|nr:hypothetical protein AVEN_25684-1 [Araneus ventricosus]
MAQVFASNSNGRTFGSYVSVNVQQVPYMSDLHWNRVSNLELSGPESETLTLRHLGSEGRGGYSPARFVPREGPRPFSLPLSLFVKPCCNGVWLGQTSSRSRFALVDCGRWNSNRRTVPTARGFANISAALE